MKIADVANMNEVEVHFELVTRRELSHIFAYGDEHTEVLCRSLEAAAVSKRTVAAHQPGRVPVVATLLCTSVGVFALAERSAYHLETVAGQIRRALRRVTTTS